MNYITLGGFKILKTDRSSLVSELNHRIIAGQKTILMFANTNFIVKCQSLRDWVCDADIFLVNDGIGLSIATYLFTGKKFSENLNGTDFIPFFLHLVKCNVYFFGAESDIVEKAAQNFQNKGIKVVGFCDGFFKKFSPEILIKDINQSESDVILVALGNPLQEQWIFENLHKIDCKIFIAVGALFDFMSGKRKRAPQWMRCLKMEWLYRLALEPKRLLNRYTIDIVRFFWICFQRERMFTQKW